MLENPYSNKFLLEQNKTQVKVLFVIAIVETLLWWPLEIYSNQTYVAMISICSTIGLMFCLEMVQPSLGQSFKALVIGLIPILIVVLVPKHTLIALCGNFANFGLGFSDLPLSKMPILLLSNAVGWIICYQFLYVEGYEGEKLVRFLFQDQNNFFQIIMSVFVALVVILSLSRKKYTEKKIHEKHQEALVNLNKDLEAANSNLKKVNEELRLALQEKESFILRFSHEIRNPLNSLLGNVELCFESTEDAELKTMLTDAKVSGEILLHLLNNILDTAKVSAGRLEASIHPQKIRDFLQRAWVICSEIIRKRGLYGCLSVNLNVPEVLEFDNHRVMQILINTVSNASKFTEAGHVKVFVDFIKGKEITAEAIKPRYVNYCENQPNERESLNCLTAEDVNEHPKQKHEHLTFSNKKFSLNRTTFMNHFKDTIEMPILSPHKLRECVEPKEEYLEILPVAQNGIPAAELEDEGFIRLEIVDSGCGIKKEDLPTLFEPFKQVNVDPSRRQIGTGLGLWITKEITKLMQGRIEVYSKPDQGTAFVVMLKSKASSLAAVATETKLSPTQLKLGVPATLSRIAKHVACLF